MVKLFPAQKWIVARMMGRGGERMPLLVARVAAYHTNSSGPRARPTGAQHRNHGRLAV